MAVSNGHAVHATAIATRPLILTLGQIRVSLLLFPLICSHSQRAFYLGLNTSFYPDRRMDCR